MFAAWELQRVIEWLQAAFQPNTAGLHIAADLEASGQ